MAGSPGFFGEGHTPRVNDTLWRIEQKVLGALIDVGGGVISGGLWTVAAGAPPVDGSITTMFYKNSVTGFRYANLATVAAPDWDVL